MPTIQHDGTLEVVRDRPAVVAELLRDVMGVPVPEFTHARVQSGDLPDVHERRADLIVLLENKEPRLVVVFEVQLDRDKEKSESWPYYVAAARRRFHCPTVLLVFSPKKAVAAWCAAPIETGHPGFTLSPLVLGPDTIRRITDPDEAAQHVELALLSVMAHRSDPAIKEIITAAFKAFDQSAASRSDTLTLYYDLAIAAVPEAVAKWAEAQMVSDTYEFQSNFFRKKIADAAKEAAKEATRTAKAEATAETKAEDILLVLEARDVPVSDTERELITSATDSRKLSRWLRRAVTAQQASDLFAD